MDLIIKKNGILWDREDNKQVTDTIRHLYDYCDIDEDVTLRDIFMLLQKEIVYYQVVIGNWVDEIVNEGLTKPPKKDKEVEFLELYWALETEKSEGTSSLNGINFPALHGQGFKLKEETDGFKVGSRMPYAIEFTPANELIKCPVYLKKEHTITHWDFDTKDEDKKLAQGATYNTEFTLGHILYGIIWELSFMGGPSDRDEKADEIRTTVEDIKSGEAKTIPIENINNI